MKEGTAAKNIVLIKFTQDKVPVDQLKREKVGGSEQFISRSGLSSSLLQCFSGCKFNASIWLVEILISGDSMVQLLPILQLHTLDKDIQGTDRVFSIHFEVRTKINAT